MRNFTKFLLQLLHTREKTVTLIVTVFSQVNNVNKD